MTLSPRDASNSSSATGSLNADQLVGRAEAAINSGRTDEGIQYLRQAMQKAPMRHDLRDMLFTALELRGGAPRQVKMRTPPRQPLFDDHEAPAPPPKIEALRSDEPRRDERRRDERRQEQHSHDRASSHRQRDRRDEPPRAQSRSTRESYREEEREARRDRRPSPSQAEPSSESSRLRAPSRGRSRSDPTISTLGLALFTFVFLSVVLGGAGWFYLVANKKMEETVTPDSKGGSTGASGSADSTVARQDRALQDQAREYLNQGLYSMAVEKLNQLSESPEKHTKLAEVYSSQGDECTRERKYEEARRAYEKALENEPKSDKYLYDLGWTCYLIGREMQAAGDATPSKESLTKAEQHFKNALAINPNHLKSLDGLAMVESARNNPPGAGEYLRRIIQINPDTPEAESAKRKLLSMGLKL